jgi:hypothetical protein
MFRGHGGDGPMTVMLILVLLGLLLVAAYIVATLIEEKREDETWGPAAPGRPGPWAWRRRKPSQWAHR